MDSEARLPKRALDSGHEPIDVGASEAEEVEVARLSPNVAPCDQGGAAGESEISCLLEAGNDLCDALLKRRQQLGRLAKAVSRLSIRPRRLARQAATHFREFLSRDAEQRRSES